MSILRQRIKRAPGLLCFLSLVRERTEVRVKMLVRLAGACVMA